ncbi:MAG: twin-arginine translocase TatA/TatE family subunit [Bdellovibrionales bacterium]|nr:twin-arginine translocase TatA/TatE family subunit [Bdellovibrionales bacterium]
MSPSLIQILIVVGIALLLFGPKRIPGIGRSMGEAIRGFKKGLTEDEIDVTDSVKQEKLSEETDTAKTAKQTTSESQKKEEV